MKNITIWNEFRHEKINERVAAVYPKGIHGALAEFIAANPEYRVRTATLDEPESGLTQEVLDSTDVLIWWGHKAHDDLPDEIARRVHQRVLEGMGFIALHSEMEKIGRKGAAVEYRSQSSHHPGDRRLF